MREREEGGTVGKQELLGKEMDCFQLYNFRANSDVEKSDDNARK